MFSTLPCFPMFGSWFPRVHAILLPLLRFKKPAALPERDAGLCFPYDPDAKSHETVFHQRDLIGGI
jgi:hypothetical protein